MSQSQTAIRPRLRRASAASGTPGPDDPAIVAQAAPAPSPAVVDASVLDFAAALSMDQMERFERTAQDIGVSRRVTLMTLTKSKEELVQIIRDLSADKDSDGLVGNILASLDGWREHLRECLKLAECAEAQMVCAIDTLEAADR